MKKIIRTLIIVLCIISFLKTMFNCINYKNVQKEYKKSILGTIVYIDKKSNKSIIDIKEKKKYRIIIYDNINYKLGDKILVEGKFYTPSNNTVFNIFNYRKYLLSKNIDTIINPYKIELIEKNKNIFFKLKNIIDEHINDYKSSSYLKAFLLGDLGNIKEDIKENYQSIGISHLMAISGMHVSIIILIINFFVKKSKNKNTIVFLFLVFYLFLTNYSISLKRVILFILLKHLNNKLNLNISSIMIHILTVFILLLINSFYIYNVGFLFSTIITFFIILSRNIIKRLNSYIKKLAVISLISFLSSIPILTLNFFKINLASVFFNILFVPFISFIVFPLSIITFIFPFLDSVFFFFITLLENITLILGRLNIFNIVISKPTFIFIILYYISLFLAIKLDKRFIIIFVIVFILNINSNFFRNNLEITFLDVGQGDCSIIILPKGKTILIDTGGSYNDEGKISKNKIIPYLNSNGISSIEYLIITHGDFDHMGEAINLVNNFKIEKVIFNCGEFNDLEKELIKILNKKKIPYYSCVKELYVDSNKLYFLQTKEYDNENDNSNVIYTDIDGYKFMFMGDAGVEVEENLIEKYNLQDIDVLKVGHHGSKTSSSKYFIDSINPKYSLISVGKNNRYGHPNDSVLDILKDSKVYRTDLDGSIMFKIKNNKLQINTCPP